MKRPAYAGQPVWKIEIVWNARAQSWDVYTSDTTTWIRVGRIPGDYEVCWSAMSSTAKRVIADLLSQLPLS